MLYDVRLRLHYAYAAAVSNARQVFRVLPATIRDSQRVIAASLRFAPDPDERIDGRDYFGCTSTAILCRRPHASFEALMSARVEVDRVQMAADTSPDLPELLRELREVRGLDPGSPHHFTGASPRVTAEPAITAFAGDAMRGAPTVQAGARALCDAIHASFVYDPEATEADTPPGQAFALRRGVCQDFAQVMIAGLRGVGVPAAYVSGYLRTIPPPGAKRLEGADAMHAWVRVWCGLATGWVEFDPTNAMLASNDHIVVGHGRDYGDVAPIIGMVKTSGGQKAGQAVDVIALP